MIDNFLKFEFEFGFTSTTPLLSFVFAYDEIV
jgi:hypothetical protein